MMVETLIERLRAADANSQQRVLGSGIFGEAADRLEANEREKEELRKERDEARQALEHDRSKVIEAVNQFSDAFARRSWLLDSRGSYEWDDERYRDEFRGAYDELAAPIQQLKAIGKDWSNCPTNHDEIMRARNDWLARAETAERQLAERDADLARVQKLIEGRDAFIVSRDLWGDFVATLPARAALAGSGDGWRDMSDAPKDGTVVDLWCQAPGLSAGPVRVTDCWFSDGKWWRYDEHGDDQLRSRVHNATHWMPRPASPFTAGER